MIENCVLVTGVSSYLGFELASGFFRAGFSVVGTISNQLNQYPELQRNRLKSLERQGIVLEHLDLEEKAGIANLLTRCSPSLWIHHAGFARGYESPTYDRHKGYKINVDPIFSLYRLLDDSGCRGVIVSGSSMEYSETRDACIEMSTCQPATAYGQVKLAQTLAAIQCSREFGIPTRVARLFMIFGPGEEGSRLIPAVTAALRRNEPVAVSSCFQQRDLLYVDDFVNSYICLAKDIGRGDAEIYNVCSGQPQQLRDVLKLLAELTGRSADLIRFGAKKSRIGEPFVSYGSSDKLRSLDWSPLSLRESLRRYVDAVGFRSGEIDGCLGV